MTPQVQDAIHDLLAAGLRRSEFRVRVSRRWRTDAGGRQVVEYGSPRILLLCGADRAVDVTEQLLLRGFNVDHVVDDTGRVRYVSVERSFRPRSTLTVQQMMPRKEA